MRMPLTPAEAERLLGFLTEPRPRWRVHVEWGNFSAANTDFTVWFNSLGHFRAERRAWPLFWSDDELPIVAHETELSSIEQTELKGLVELCFRQYDPITAQGDRKDDDGQGFVNVSLFDGSVGLAAFFGSLASITQAGNEASRLVEALSRRMPDGFGQ